MLIISIRGPVIIYFRFLPAPVLSISGSKGFRGRLTPSLFSADSCRAPLNIQFFYRQCGIYIILFLSEKVKRIITVIHPQIK